MEIIRTWPMRGTLHFISNKDVRWVLSLYPERGIPNYARRNGMDEKILDQGKKAIIRAFIGRKQITRRELHAFLKSTKIPELGHNWPRNYIMRRAARAGLICFGPNVGKQQSFVLLDDCIDGTKPLRREDALAALAERYFASHGPATVRDFAWWSGSKMADAKIGIETANAKLREEPIGDNTYWMHKRIAKYHRSSQIAHLLPAFDEYLIAYNDRSAILDSKYSQKIIAGSTFIYLPIILFDGQVVGTWKQISKNDSVQIMLKPFYKLDGAQREAIGIAADRYGAFLGKKVTVK